MSGSVGITASVANTQVYAAQPVANVTATATSSTQASSTSSATTGSFSSKLIVDPLAGVITEFLDGQGNIRNEIPSTTVIAYLKAGLTAQGYSKENLPGNLA